MVLIIIIHRRHGLNVYLVFSPYSLRMKDKTDKEKRRAQTRKAVESRQRMAEEHDEIVEQHIQENPGLTSVELEKIMKTHHGFERSYLKNALARLEKKGKIIGKLGTSKEGKIVKRYEFSSSKNQLKKVRGAITVPIQRLDNEKQWKQHAFVYAERSNEIEIMPVPSKKLAENSFIKETGTVSLDDGYLTVTLPVRLTEFLELDVDNYITKINKNSLKIKIIPKIEKPQKKAKTINNILLLEDNDYWADEFTKKLTEYGYTVFVAKNIEETTKYDATKIDYCILDDKIKFKNEAEKYFVLLKKINPNVEGTFVTVEPINKSRRERLTRIGFSSIIQKHRTDDTKKDLEEILNEQIVRLEMFSA